jgi:hypothetical protein
MKYILLTIYIFGLSACSFLDSSDDVPMYLDVESVSFSTKPGEGAGSSNITNVSVFSDGFNIGVFPYPGAIPVLDLDGDGKISLDIFAGIKNNGQGSNQISYPFYKSIQLNYTYEENKHIPLNLEFEYKDEIQFVYNDDFENSIMFNYSGQETQTDFVQSDEAIYGNFCGLIETMEGQTIFEEESSFRRNRSEVENSILYLEMDYKNTIPFQVGYIAYAGNLGIRNYKLVLTPSEEWNKVYIELTQEVNLEDFDQMAILLGSASANDIGKVWIDNVKLLRLNP